MKRPGKPGQIYLLCAVGTSFWKIGFSAHSVGRRAMDIQCACPFEVRIAGVAPGTMRIERRIHRALWRYRFNGEWFSLPERIAWRVLRQFAKYGWSVVSEGSDAQAEATQAGA